MTSHPADEAQSRATVVVGGGPVGLACALALKGRGVEVAVLEAEPEDRPRPGSRALYLHGRSLELLEEMRRGLGREIAAHGMLWTTKRTLWRGREVFRRTYPPPRGDALPPFTSLPQTSIERILLDACKAAHVEVVWDSRVAAVTSGGTSVEVRADDGRRWRADFVVGADGPRSTVRDAIGVPLEGERSENAYVIVDVAEDPSDPRPPERVFHYEHPAVGARNVLLVPFAGGWRVDLQCRRDDDTRRFGEGEGLRRWIAAVMGERYADRITWVSTYRFLQVIARALADEHRRVLLVGDAAHLFPPFGARGLNSGIADAAAAARAITQARSAGDRAAARDAVDRFAHERLDAARRNRWAAGKALAAIQGRDPLVRARRRVAAALAPRIERAGAWLDAAPYGPKLSTMPRRGGSGY